jgi:hypothetical protein
LGGSDTELVAADAAFETCVANEFLFPHSELGFVRTAAARRVEISLTMTALGPLTEIAAALLLRWHPLTLIRKQAKAKSAVYLRVFRWSRAHSTHSADGVILHSLDLDPSRQCLLATTFFFRRFPWLFVVAWELIVCNWALLSCARGGLDDSCARGGLDDWDQ